MQFASPGVCTLHRPADVEHDVDIHVRFSVEFLHIQTPLTGVYLPIHMSQVVALYVFTMRIEFDAEAHERTTMQAMHEAFDDRLRPQLDIVESREEHGIYEFGIV